jgi:hypothetical protein
MHQPHPGTAPFVPSSIDYAKDKAKLLRKLAYYAKLSLARAQQTTAKALGHADWHALDESLKQHLPASPLSPDLAPKDQAARWRTQRDALLTVPGIDPPDVAYLLEQWALTGRTAKLTSFTDSDLAQAITCAWPKDRHQIEREVRNTVMFVAQRLAENSDVATQGSIKELLFQSYLAHPIVLRESMLGHRNEPKPVSQALREELVQHNDAVNEVCQTAIGLLGGGSYGPTQNGHTSDAVKSTLVEQLYADALAYAGQKSIWDLLFYPPGLDGLTQFHNSGKSLSISDGRGGDDEEVDDELEDDSAMPPYPAAVVRVPVSQGPTVEIRQVPDYNEYGDSFRLTRIQANLRTAAGDNIGFLNGRLYEADTPGVRAMDFLMVADSQDQGAMDMAEAITAAFPRITQCFDTGALLHVEALELATIARKGDNSRILLGAVLAHASTLAGRVSALCLDVRPVQFPWFDAAKVPSEVRDESARVNKKLRKRLQSVLKHPAFATLATKLVRYCCFDSEVEKL